MDIFKDNFNTKQLINTILNPWQQYEHDVWSSSGTDSVGWYSTCSLAVRRRLRARFELVSEGKRTVPVKRHGKLERGSEGLLVVSFLKPADVSSIWPQYLYGTVCDESFDDHAANLTCQALGHKYAISWGSGPDNFRYVPEEFLENANVKILIDDVRCGADATDIKECQASIMEGHDCSFSQSLWLKCEKKVWEVSRAELIWFDEETGRSKKADEGLVFVTGFDYRSGDMIQGTVCDQGTFDNHAANLACQRMGYKQAVSWGTKPENFQYVPEEMITARGVPIVIDEVQCDNGTADIKERKARLLKGVDHDCSYDDNLWLKCSK